MKGLAICAVAALLQAGAVEIPSGGMEALASSDEYEHTSSRTDESVRDEVLLSDDFSVPSDRWDVGAGRGGETRYVDGAMFVRAVTESDGSIYVTYDRTFTDHAIQVETRLVGGTDDNWQTVSCRLTGDNDYYDLGISADGYFLLDVWVDGKRLGKSIGPSRSRHIRQGRNVVNDLTVECVGSTLRLSVNGHVLAEIEDDAHTSGQIGLSVDSMAGRYSEVAFDNLVVTGG